MTSPDHDRVFSGSVPKVYDTFLVPLIFEPYARDLAARLAERSPMRVLEIACGTGIVTRAIRAVLPNSSSIVATDLNQAMLDHAMSVHVGGSVDWRRADAMQLPFTDASFDAVVCQFGAMFFPDRPKAFSETRRVLRPGGVFIFSVWDRIEENDFADTVTTALAAVYRDDPPRFLARTPHGYHDLQTIRRDVAAAGFKESPEIDTIPARSRAESFRNPAIGYCQGTPLRSEIEARDPNGLLAATDAAAQAIAERFGSGSVDGKIQAHVVTVVA